MKITKWGQIEEGKLKGKRVILEPRIGLKDNEYLIEKGVFMNGSSMYHKACLNKSCQDYIGNHCQNCK